MAQAQKRPVFSAATANKVRALPKFQSTRKTPATSSQFVDELDPLLKLNKGGFTALGTDAESNIPFRVMGAEPIAVGEAPDQAPLATPYNQGGQAYQLENLPENPFTGTRQEVNPSIDQFMDYLNQVLESQGYGTGVTPNLPYNGAQGIASMPDGGILYDDGMIRYEDNTEREYTGQQAQPIQSMQDGSIRYSDGTFRKPAAAEPYGIASMEGNMVRRSDGSIVYGPYMTQIGANMPGGLRGLVSGIFGQDRTVTQDYGNVNPMEPTPGNINYGTDLRTRDLAGAQRELKLPVGATVVQVLKDDGTRFGDKSGHQGYGNSLLLRLPSGEMLRFSHLSQVLDVKEGDTINPGETFGIPGTTGNTAGEHLDLEYYNANGQIANPASFTGFTDPQSILPNQPQPGSLVPGQTQNQSRVPTTPGGQSTQQPQIDTPVTDAITSVVQPVVNAVQNVNQAIQPMSPQRQAAGQGVNEAGKFLADRGVGASIGNSPEGFAGAGEIVAGDLPAAGREQSATIERVKPFQQLDPTGKDRVDLGISELLRGDVQGAAQNFGDTAQRIGARVSKLPGQIADVVAPPAFASDGSNQQDETFLQNLQGAAGSVGNYIGSKGQEIKTTFSDATKKPIEGINKLKSEFQSGIAEVGQGFNDVINKMGPKKQVGEESGGDQNILGAPNASSEKNDIRDPFFKLGGAETYGKYINENMVGDGGLSLDLFKGDFFKDADAIANVLGSTHLLKPAQDRFRANEAAKYPKMSKMAYEEGYDRSAIDDYNRQIDQYNASIDSYLSSIDLSTKNPTYGEAPRSSQSIIPGTNFSPNVSMSQQRALANQGLFSGAFTLGSPNLNSPTAGASASLSPTALNLKSLNVNVPSNPARAPQAPGVSIQQARDTGSRTGMGVPAIQTPNRTINAPQGSTLRVDSGGSIQAVPKASVTLRNGSVADFSTPTKTVSAQLAPRSTTPAKSGGTNIFSKAVNAVKKLFGR